MPELLALEVDPAALRRSRLAAAMTQHELAKAAGVNRSTVARLENGQPASPRTVRLIAVALGVSPAAIASVVEVSA